MKWQLQTQILGKHCRRIPWIDGRRFLNLVVIACTSCRLSVLAADAESETEAEDEATWDVAQAKFTSKKVSGERRKKSEGAPD